VGVCPACELNGLLVVPQAVIKVRRPMKSRPKIGREFIAVPLFFLGKTTHTARAAPDITSF
jgi:hypothetical protein